MPSPTPTTPLHVVLGAGQVGPLVAARLLARGHRVRIVRRRDIGAGVAGAEQVTADLRDPDQAAAAMRGAAVVYHCVNPLYTEWPTEVPAMTRGILAGAARTGARLVVLDNLYMYGDTARMHGDSPVAPPSKKGAVRAAAAEAWLAAHRRGDVPVAIGRASDFFGPGSERAVLGDRFYRRVLAGKAAEVLGDPDLPHSFSYTPDVAAGLVALGDSDGDHAFGRVWMLPVQPAETTRALIARLGRGLGRDIALRRVPAWMVRAMGLLDGELRELVEMLYQWQQPYVVDDGAFRAAFGVAPTPWDQAIAATAAWAVARYGAVSPGKASTSRPHLGQRPEATARPSIDPR